MADAKDTELAAGDTSPEFKRRFMIRLVIVLIGGMFLDGYILGIVGPVSGTVAEDLQISPLMEGLIAAAALFGILVGSPLGGWAADRFGRKPLFMIDIALFSIASAMQFFVHEPELLFVVRLLMGIAIGAEYSVGWPMLSEFAPTHLRGRLLGATLIAWYTGFMLAYLIGYLMVHNTDLSWQFILGTSTFLAVALFLARLGLPESPRLLWSVNRHDEARALAHRYLGADTFADVEHEDTRKGSFGMLFSKQYWRATLFTSGFWFCAVAPYFAIATFADSVLQQYGLSGGLAGGVGLSAVALAGVVVTFFLIDKAGRRVLTVPPQWLCAVVLAVIGFWVGAPAVVILILFLVFSFFNAMYTTLTGVYPGEMFPTEIRGIGTGFAAAMSRLGAGAGTFLLPVAVVNLGIGPSMLIAAVVAFIGAGLSQWLAPETKGRASARLRPASPTDPTTDAGTGLPAAYGHLSSPTRTGVTMTIAVAHSDTARGKAALHSAAKEALWRGEPLAVLRIVAGVDEPRDDPALERELGVDLAEYQNLTWQLHATAEKFDTAESLLDLASELDASLLVIGSRRRTAVGKVILGSTVQQVLLKSLIPVLVVKAA